MPAFYNGRELGPGEFAVVLDGITYVGRVMSFNSSQVAGAQLRLEFNGVVTDREGAVASTESVNSIFARPSPAPVAHAVPPPRLRVQYVDYTNLPVRGEANCLYVISPHDALGAGVELPCAYVYRPTFASDGALNTLPYKPTNISATRLRAAYAQAELFPRRRAEEDDLHSPVIYRVPGVGRAMQLLVSNAHVIVSDFMVRPVEGPTLGARGAVPAQSVPSVAAASPTPLVRSLPVSPLTVRILPWRQLPIVGDHDTLYCVSDPTGVEGREVFEENAYVYRPGGPDDPRPYKATNVSAAIVAREHVSGDRLPHVDAIVRDLAAAVPVCYVTTASTVPREVRTRSDVLAWILPGLSTFGITAHSRPGHLVVPAVSSGASSISVPQVSPQTARDIMTRGWGTSLASTTFVEELPPHLSLARPGDLEVGGPPRDLITFVPGAAQALTDRLTDRMMAEVNAAIASEADQQFTAAVDAVLNTQTDPEVVADLVDGMAATEAPETAEMEPEPVEDVGFYTVHHVSHHHELPPTGDTASLYCVFGYPMAFIYRAIVLPNQQVCSGYFPTNVDAAIVARRYLDGAFMPRFSLAIGSQGRNIVRFAYDSEHTPATGFQISVVFALSSGPNQLWSHGPSFWRREEPGATTRRANAFQQIFPTVHQTFPAPDLPNLDEIRAPDAPSAPATPPSPPARRLILD